MNDDLFRTHSDVRRAWPDLFINVDARVADMVAATAADSILEGLPMDRQFVQELIDHSQSLKPRHLDEKPATYTHH